MSLLAKLGLAVLPTAVNVGNELLNPSKPTDIENKLGKMAGVFENDATSPITDNRVFQEGITQLNSFDKRNREQGENIAGAGNVTQDAKLSVMQGANDTFANAFNQLFRSAQRFREFSQGKFMNTLALQDNFKQQRLGRRQQNTASIIQPLTQATGAVIESDFFKTKK
jgi:hypothetical protein